MMTRVWLHKKTGGLYTIEHEAIQEADVSPVVVYRSLSDGVVWVRPAEEFYDGRFVRAEANELKCHGLSRVVGVGR